MRIAVIGASVIASLVLVTFVSLLRPSVGLAQPSQAMSPDSKGGLIALAAAAGEHHQQVTVIDSDARVISVYHIDLATGEIMLKSVRKIHWDLQMTEFNGTKPFPGEVRSLLDQK